MELVAAIPNEYEVIGYTRTGIYAEVVHTDKGAAEALRIGKKAVTIRNRFDKREVKQWCVRQYTDQCVQFDVTP